MNTTPDIIAAIAAETARLQAGTKINSWGDLESAPADATVYAGRSLPGIRCTKLLGWGQRGPEKQVVYVSSLLLDRLTAESKKMQKAKAAAEKKAAENAAAVHAGYTSIADWKAAIKAAEAAATAADFAAVGLAEQQRYVPVLHILIAAKEDGMELAEAHAEAVLYAQKTKSSAYVAFINGDLSAAEVVHRCERAQFRHRSTDYEQLLAEGYERDDARAMRRSVVPEARIN